MLYKYSFDCGWEEKIMKPVVALLGRPNVGKSTLFNRLAGSRQALVDDMPGVTRDRQYCEASWEDIDFSLVDTGGFLRSDTDYFADDIKEQLDMVVMEADVLVFIMDGKEGLSSYDKELSIELRKAGKPLFYLVNKIESGKLKDDLYEFYSLGIDQFYPVAAEHGIGVADFLDDLIKILPKESLIEQNTDDKSIRIAVVGRPNVGKSSLVNRLFGEKRVIVNKKAGTTRDSVELSMEHNNKLFLLVDTAGIRRKGKVREKIEKFSIIKSLQSMDDCDVALIVIDVEEGITDQDITIAGYAEKKGCGVLFLLNKWDLLEKEEKNQKKFIEDLRYKAKFLSHAPALTISALTGLRTNKIFKSIQQIYDEYSYRINTGLLNRIIEDAVLRVEPSMHKGKRLKFYYSAQVAVKPPCFVCFVNYPEAVHFSYKRYLLNQIRQISELEKTPLQLLFRQRTSKNREPDKYSKPSLKLDRYQKKKQKTQRKRRKNRKEQNLRKIQRESE